MDETTAITAAAVRGLHRHPNASATLHGPDGAEITKDEILAAIDSYIDAGGEVDERGEPAEWETVADELAS